jgi:hypothetical protein
MTAIIICACIGLFLMTSYATGYIIGVYVGASRGYIAGYSDALNTAMKANEL